MSLPRSSLDLKYDVVPILAALLSTGHYTADDLKGDRWQFELNGDGVPLVVSHAVLLAEAVERICEKSVPTAQ